MATPADDLVGTVGRVTVRVVNGHVGMVMLPYRGGYSEFPARPAEPGALIERNAVVLVVAYDRASGFVAVAEDPTVTPMIEALAPPPVS